MSGGPTGPDLKTPISPYGYTTWSLLVGMPLMAFVINSYRRYFAGTDTGNRAPDGDRRGKARKVTASQRNVGRNIASSFRRYAPWLVRNRYGGNEVLGLSLAYPKAQQTQGTRE